MRFLYIFFISESGRLNGGTKWKSAFIVFVLYYFAKTLLDVISMDSIVCNIRFDNTACQVVSRSSCFFLNDAIQCVMDAMDLFA